MITLPQGVRACLTFHLINDESGLVAAIRLDNLKRVPVIDATPDAQRVMAQFNLGVPPGQWRMMTDAEISQELEDERTETTHVRTNR